MQVGKNHNNIAYTITTSIYKVLTDVFEEKVQNLNDALMWILCQTTTEYGQPIHITVKESVSNIQYYNNIMPYSFVFSIIIRMILLPLLYCSWEQL